MAIDYSLYLVTCRDLLPAGISYEDSLEQALKGGVTVVQVREKNAETREFLQIANATKRLCKRYGAPLIINDRIDIALAVGADGVHLGQDDMPIQIARKLLPKNMVIGISCSNLEEVERAISEGADYVGIGPVYQTSTKVTDKIVPPEHFEKIFAALSKTRVKSVAIGGITSKNAEHLLSNPAKPFGGYTKGAVKDTSSRPRKTFDGLAVISNIVASSTPKEAAEQLKSIIAPFKPPPVSSYNTATICALLCSFFIFVYFMQSHALVLRM